MTIMRRIRIRRTRPKQVVRELEETRAVFKGAGGGEFSVVLSAEILEAPPARLSLSVSGKRACELFDALVDVMLSAAFVEATDAPERFSHAQEYVPKDDSLLIPFRDLQSLPMRELLESLGRFRVQGRLRIAIESLDAARGKSALGDLLVARGFAMLSDLPGQGPPRTPDWSSQSDVPTMNEVRASALCRVRVSVHAPTATALARLDEVVRAHLPVKAIASSPAPQADALQLVHLSNVPSLLQLPRLTADSIWIEEELTPALATLPSIPTSGLCLGTVEALGSTVPLSVCEADAREHVYVVGKTGSGKTTQLISMIVGAIQPADRAVIVVDPHGDMSRELLDWLPPEHVKRAVYVDFSRDDFLPGINLFDASTEGEIEYAIGESQLLFLEMFGPEIFGPRIQDVFRNTAQLLCRDESGPNSLLDLVWGVMLTNDNVLKRWQALARKSRSLTLQLYLDQVLAIRRTSGSVEELIPYFRAKFSPLADCLHTRCILGQGKTTLDLKSLIADKAICLFNLNRGRLSAQHASLIGRVLTIRILAAAMSSAAQSIDKRPPVTLFIDEFHSLVSPTIESCLSEARKFKLNLVLANQFLGQLNNKSFDIGRQIDMVAAIIGNVGTLSAFRVSPSDATRIAEAMGRPDLAQAMTSLPRYRSIVSMPSTLGRPLVCTTRVLDAKPDDKKRQAIIRRSIELCCRPRADIEREIRARFSAALGTVDVPINPIGALFGD